MSGLRLALTTLTVAPVRGPERIDRRTAGRAMELAPLVGVMIGLASAVVLLIGSATPMMPAIAPSTATNMTVWPSARIDSACGPNAPASTWRSSMSFVLPSTTR